MNAAPLPALAAIAPIAPAAPVASAAPATPGAFAQELSQAQTAAPTDAQAPEVHDPSATAGDEAAPAKPAAPGEEAPVSKSLRQWLQQQAAARRAAQKGPHDTAGLPAKSNSGNPSTDIVDSTARPRPDLRAADTEPTPLATTNNAQAKDAIAVDGETDLGTLSGSAQAAEPTTTPVAPDASGTTLAAPTPAATPAAAAPTPVATGPTSQPALPSLAASIPGTTTDAEPSGKTGQPVATADSGEGRGGLRAALPERASPGDGTPVEATRGGLAGAKALRESATEPGAPAEERESFATVLARQQEGTAIVVPPAPQAAGGTPRLDAAGPAPRPTVDVPIPAEFNGPQWAQSVGSQLSLLATDGVQNARLHLHPAEMGPISVQIVVDGQTAQVHLAVDNAETRQALEQAMPNLAASLRESGLTLTGGGVFEQPRQRADQAPADGRSNGGRASERGPEGGLADPAQAGAPAARTVRRQGVVDLYA